MSPGTPEGQQSCCHPTGGGSRCPYAALGHTGQGLAVTQAHFPHLCALMCPWTRLNCSIRVHSSLHSSEMKDELVTAFPRQAVGKERDPAFFPFLLPPQGQILLLILHVCFSLQQQTEIVLRMTVISTYMEEFQLQHLKILFYRIT